jgi:hypothetical protein
MQKKIWMTTLGPFSKIINVPRSSQVRGREMETCCLPKVAVNDIPGCGRGITAKPWAEIHLIY